MPPAPLLTDPALRPYLPLVWAAWAEGSPGPDEAVAARAVLARGALAPASADRLLGWLDPAAPPAAAELAALDAAVRGAVRERGLRAVSPVELGVALADPRVPPDRAALAGLAEALGVGLEEVRPLLAPGAEAAARPAPAPFDVAALTRHLDGAERASRERMRAVLARPDFAIPVGLAPGEHRALVLRWLEALAREGFGTQPLPAAVGGAGDQAGFLAAFEVLGHHDQSLAVKFGVQFGLFAGSVAMLGTERHLGVLHAAARLELPGCFAMSELAHGSNVRDLETEARYDVAAREFVIHTPHDGARKEWIGNAALHGRMAVVFAQLVVGDVTHGVHAFLVPIRDAEGRALPGVRIGDCGHKMGLPGVDNGRLWFDRVRVPRTNLLNRWGDVAEDGTYASPVASPSARFFTMLGTLVGGRVSVPRFALSAAKTGLAIAVRYADRRRQFGAPGAPERLLLDYPAHQRRLLPALATTYACHAALQDLGARYVALGDGPPREVESLAAALKAYATAHVTSALQAARECCGGQGYLAVNRIATLRSDTDIYTTFEGDNTVLLQLVARGLLTGYRQQFANLGGALRTVARQASRRLAQANPITARLTDEAHLRDPEAQLALLRFREERLLATAAQRLRRRLADGADPFDGFVDCQDHLLTLARAHAERVVAESFRGWVRRAPPVLAPVLRDLCDLHVLAGMERDAAWYLAAGAMDGARVRAVRALVLRLCGDLRPAAEGLVDAFAIPAQLLSPIAFDALPAAD